jgi:hypothetical protein
LLSILTLCSFQQPSFASVVGDASDVAARTAPESDGPTQLAGVVKRKKKAPASAAKRHRAAGKAATHANAPKTRPYAHLKDHKSVGPGKGFTSAQKNKILAANRLRNGGRIKSDDPKDPHKFLVPSRKSMKGVKPPAHEAQIDHIHPQSKGGANSFKNAHVISRKHNRAKWNK